MLVSNLDYDTHKGKIAIGRIWRGKVSPHDSLVVLNADGSATPFEVGQVFTHLGLKREEVTRPQPVISSPSPVWKKRVSVILWPTRRNRKRCRVLKSLNRPLK